LVATRLFVDPQRLRLDVDIVPSQREHLAASQAEQRTEPERHRPAVLGRRLEEAIDIGGIPRDGVLRLDLLGRCSRQSDPSYCWRAFTVMSVRLAT
jgi:hypothetical protein